MNINKLRRQLEIDEGVKYEIYNDHLLKKTFVIQSKITIMVCRILMCIYVQVGTWVIMYAGKLGNKRIETKGRRDRINKSVQWRGN